MCDGKRHLLFCGEEGQIYKEWVEINLELRASEKGIQDKRSYWYSYQYRWEPCQGIRGILSRQECGQDVTRTAHVGGSQEVTGAGGPGERDGNGAGKIQTPGNMLGVEAFSLSASHCLGRQQNVAGVIPRKRVNLS